MGRKAGELGEQRELGELRELGEQRELGEMGRNVETCHGTSGSG